jgi:hypothetical protein
MKNAKADDELLGTAVQQLLIRLARRELKRINESPTSGAVVMGAGKPRRERMMRVVVSWWLALDSDNVRSEAFSVPRRATLADLQKQLETESDMVRAIVGAAAPGNDAPGARSWDWGRLQIFESTMPDIALMPSYAIKHSSGRSSKGSCGMKRCRRRGVSDSDGSDDDGDDESGDRRTGGVELFVLPRRMRHDGGEYDIPAFLSARRRSVIAGRAADAAMDREIRRAATQARRRATSPRVIDWMH